MWTKHWMPFITTLSTNLWIKRIALTLLYILIMIGLIVMYGKGDFSMPAFIYQGF
jgi:hypothetical protein